MHDRRPSRSADIDVHRIVLVYAVFAGLWILVSDRVAEWMFGDVVTLTVVATLKGWIFVAVTSLLLFLLLKRYSSRRDRDAAPSAIVAWRSWQLYLFAAAISLFTIPIRQSIAVGFNEHQMLILFMFPVILSAAIGGFGPGLLATAISTLSAAWFALAPIGSLRLEHFHDLYQLAFLAAEGLLVSYLSMMLHAAVSRAKRERENAETSLAEKARALGLLDAIARGSSDAIFAKDLEGHYLLANHAVLRLAGKSEQEVLGRDDTNILPPEQARNVMDLDRRVLEQNRSETFEYDATTTDGTRRYQTTKGPLRDETGQVVGLFGIARDITALKMTEDALRRERDRNQRYLDTMQTIMVALDNEGRITMINHYGCQLLGYEEDELLGKNWFITCMPQPEGLDVTQPLYRKILAGTLDTDRRYENEILCRDGGRRTISWHITCFTNEIGNIDGTLSSGEDITERRQIEESLRQSEELYRSLFDHMLNGFAYCRMLYENGAPVDFVYLSVNHAFTAQTGLKDVVGRKVSEVIPGIREADPKLFEIYGRVAETGQPERFEMPVQALQMWFDIAVYSPKLEYFVAVFDVISERKEIEISLRQRNEELERFNRATVDREMDMIALKQQVNELSRQLGQQPPYPLDFLARTDQPGADTP